MNFTLYRYRKTSDHIDGHLNSDQGRLCDTVENATSAIPVGTYSISIIKCKQHSRKQPVVIIKKAPNCNMCPALDFVSNNTPMPCQCPQITPGNGMHNRHDGAIIVGKFNSSGCLIHPKENFNRIYEILRKAPERGRQITLTITENQ